MARMATLRATKGAEAKQQQWLIQPFPFRVAVRANLPNRRYFNGLPIKFSLRTGGGTASESGNNEKSKFGPASTTSSTASIRYKFNKAFLTRLHTISIIVACWPNDNDKALPEGTTREFFNGTLRKGMTKENKLNLFD
ncbi:hypothetical protein M513_07541 [Trichuris suis]|uniref:Uncharacterized protein n=1 Tax=Trichuris suis TaxID=68888 RepID=A0A085M366_9BILA|nr:hypothetical protein M513_07541 [Trichuris suis]